MSEGKLEPVGLPNREEPGVAVAVAARLRCVKDSEVDTDDFGCGGGGRKEDVDDEATKFVGAVLSAGFGSRAITDTPKRAFCGGGTRCVGGAGVAGAGGGSREVFVLYTGRVGSPRTA